MTFWPVIYFSLSCQISLAAKQACHKTKYGTDKKETSMSVPHTFFYSQCLATQARSSTMTRHFDKTFCCFFSLRTILDFFNSMLSVPSNYPCLAQLVSIAVSKIKLKQLSILHHSAPLKQTTLPLNKSPLFNLINSPFLVENWKKHSHHFPELQTETNLSSLSAKCSLSSSGKIW